MARPIPTDRLHELCLRESYGPALDEDEGRELTELVRRRAAEIRAAKEAEETGTREEE